MELKPIDPKSMLKSPGPLQSQIFEGVNVGRGNGVPTVWVGDIYKEGNLVTTVALTVWHINEYRHFELPPANIGHFHSGVFKNAYYMILFSWQILHSELENYLSFSFRYKTTI